MDKNLSRGISDTINLTLPESSKIFYQFSQIFIDTYYIEIIAKKI